MKDNIIQFDSNIAQGNCDTETICALIKKQFNIPCVD